MVQLTAVDSEKVSSVRNSVIDGTSDGFCDRNSAVESDDPVGRKLSFRPRRNAHSKVPSVHNPQDAADEETEFEEQSKNVQQRDLVKRHIFILHDVGLLCMFKK